MPAETQLSTDHDRDSVSLLGDRTHKESGEGMKEALCLSQPQ